MMSPDFHHRSPIGPTDVATSDRSVGSGDRPKDGTGDYKPLRLLVLLPFAPRLNAEHGGARVMAERLAVLAARHDVALLYLRGEGEPSADESLRSTCAVVEEVVRTPPRRARRLGLLIGLIRGRPMWATEWQVNAYRRQLRELTKRWRPHIVQIDYPIMGQYIPALNQCLAPRLLVEYDPGVAAAQDAFATERGWRRLLRYLDLQAWRRFEQDVIDRVQAVVVFTRADACLLQPLAKNTPLVPIALGASIPQQPLNPAGEGAQLVFVGSFTHPPNLDAGMRLAQRIFPAVRTRVREVRLTIVGDKPPAALRALAGQGITITGRVPDVTPYLDRAAVVVIPLRMGGGMRVKVLEALSAGKAVIASPLAVAGLNVTHGDQVLLAETDEEFCDCIYRLFTFPEERIRLAQRARAWACDALGWEHAVQAYEALYQQMIERANGEGKG